MRISTGIVLVLLVAAWPFGFDSAEGGPPEDLLDGVCVPHPSIEIQGNEGPTGFILGKDPVTGTSIPRPGSGVLSGDGTPEDPFVIERWCISSDETTGLAAIYLVNTDAHVVIRDNVIDFSSAAGGHGIRLRNAHNVVISHNTVQGATYDAVRLQGSADNVVANNTLLSNGWYGVGVDQGSTRTLVQDNYMGFNAQYGIYIINYAHTNIVRNNHFEYNVAGIRFFNNANNNLIQDNVFNDNDYGVYHTVISYNNEFHGNNIAGNTEGGFVNDVNTVLDARENWWGCADGPGEPGCDDIVLSSPLAGVDASPWLLGPNPDAGPR